MKRALLIGVAVLCAALVAFCVVPLHRGRTAPRTLVTWTAQGPLRAGAARVRIALPDHPVLAGYAGHRRARIANEPVYARALVLEAGGQRAVIANVDTLLIPPGFARPEGCAMVAATHTHTGPGGLWDNVLAGYIGAGAPDAGQQAAVEGALRQAIDAASAALGPAQLHFARERWTHGPARARSEGPIDPDLVVLRVDRPSGASVALLVVYAMHPTSAPHDVLSADWPGRLEQGDAPVLVLQGAVGNSTWPRGAPLGAVVDGEVMSLLRRAQAVAEPSLECEMQTLELPQAEASPRVPWLFRRTFANLLTLAFEAPATQTRLRIGPLTLLGVPGEPVGELGLAAGDTVLVGLADGYVGYVETPERWREGKGESAKTYFGPELARALHLWPR